MKFRQVNVSHRVVFAKKSNGLFLNIFLQIFCLGVKIHMKWLLEVLYFTATACSS